VHDSYGNNFGNYQKPPFIHNYNRRLIGWMLHDYRHLQTRIRGVHFGDIKIGQASNTSGRWALLKDGSPVIFKNAPISVAAKVINGWTSLSGSAPTASGQPLDITQTTAQKNPIHNAAYDTFRRNLFTVTSNGAKLYHLVPAKSSSAGGAQDTMAGGCGGGGDCQEFNGPYLRLDNHDVAFFVRYITVEGSSGSYTFGMSTPQTVNRFPVGVAKDNRVMTYYTVVGVADTTHIPFNVFFGDSSTSQKQYLVAVAAARPFGSRIGPFINDNCEDLYNAQNQTACKDNGLDPLYPFKGTGLGSSKVHPNFSIMIKDTSELGVKMSMSKNEYASAVPPTDQDFSSGDTHTKAYAITYGAEGRFRGYTLQNNKDKDDGFSTATTDSDYYDNDQKKIHPLGNRNSVIAWSSFGTKSIPTVSGPKVDNYEGYLEKYKGGALTQLSAVNDRKTAADGQDYRVYVFKYPEPSQDKKEWDIQPFTTRTTPKHSQMEKAFAHTMAVSEFEVSRYIIPYKPLAGQPSNDVLNYITKLSNKDAYIFRGSKNRDGVMGEDNSPITNLVTSEGGNPGDILGVSQPGDVFAESYTAWRIGSRGYKVKLINIQDVIADSNAFQNPLAKKYTLTDSGVEVDLSKINY
ncbi:MAG: hypothetical protein V1647_02935, partial [Pseudomonadota bacterium]